MDNEKLLIVQQIHARLARLEDMREDMRINSEDTDLVDLEMKSLREKLKDILNNKPLIGAT